LHRRVSIGAIRTSLFLLVAAIVAAVQPRPLLVLERIPLDRQTFNALEIHAGGDSVRVTAGESFQVWNGSSSTAHRVIIQRVTPGTPLVIEYDTTLAVAASDKSHLCPAPGVNRGMTRSVDRRGNTYQLLSREPIPAQRWRCVRLQPSEIGEVRVLLAAPSDIWTGYTKIVIGDGRTLYQASTMVDDCRTVFFERVKARLQRVRELADCNLEPFVDLDGDGIPEFLAPFSDSADAELKQLFPVERVLATYATGQ
jgi:hypothetical protein